jgi:hypothetical protein
MTAATAATVAAGALSDCQGVRAVRQAIGLGNPAGPELPAPSEATAEITPVSR